jgi:hypothetical protein
VIFPYVTIPKAAPRPYLEVVLRNGGYTSQILLALVDSGADYPIFPMEIATEFLRLDLTKAQRWTFSGTTGQPQTALLAEVHLSVLHSKDKVCFLEKRTECAFCETFKFAGGGLLGQNGFFSLFKTIFYQPRRQFEIETWETKHSK